MLTPTDTRAESALIGALLIQPAYLAEVAWLVSPEQIGHAILRLIYEAMLALYDRGVPVDFVTLFGEMEDRGTLRKVGEASITDLINKTPTGMHALAYAQRVVAKANGAGPVVPKLQDIVNERGGLRR